MKISKRFLVALLSLCLTLTALLSACSKTPDESETTEESARHYTVTFNSMGGSAVPSARVPEGGRVDEPVPPTLENRVFKHWTYAGEPWSFSKKVTSDMTLEAVWELATERFLYVTKDGVATITGMKITDEKNIVIPATIAGFPVTAVGESAFSDLTAEKVSSLTLPSTVTSIGAYAFQGCADISIHLSAATLTHIGEGAFEDCNGLGAVTLGEGLLEIPSSAFLFCSSLTSIHLPSTATRIDESAFEGCEKLSSLLIPKSVTEIGDSAFRDCTALSTLLYGGNEAELDALMAATVQNLNECFLALADSACLYSETEPEEDGSFWHYDENRLPKIW